MENSKENLMELIMESGFAMTDLILYLDTHPDDEQALRSYNDYRQIRKVAVMEYTSKYGPLNSFNVDCANFKSWTMGPWPWEGGAN